jgi:DNA-binding transcriptional LysR family regulator
MQVTDWSDFQTFLAVARAGKLAMAGEALGMDATTVSRRLRRLKIGWASRSLNKRARVRS